MVDKYFRPLLTKHKVHVLCKGICETTGAFTGRAQTILLYQENNLEIGRNINTMDRRNETTNTVKFHRHAVLITENLRSMSLVTFIQDEEISGAVTATIG